MRGQAPPGGVPGNMTPLPMYVKLLCCVNATAMRLSDVD